jgi:hypothetical protein
MNAYELADKLETDAWDEATIVQSIHLGINMLRQQQAEIDALKKDLAKYDELAIDDLNGKRTVWCACGDAITPDSGALCGNCVSARPSQTLLTMTFEEMYPIAEKHLGHAIGLYNWKIFGDAVLRKAQENG